jgi:hypothetical protein
MSNIIISSSVPNTNIVEKEPNLFIEPDDNIDILLASNWKNTKAFKEIQDKETQIKYYKKNNSCDEVLQLVDLESKPFGSVSEKIICEIFELGPRTSTQNDGTKNGKKIEITIK